MCDIIQLFFFVLFLFHADSMADSDGSKSTSNDSMKGKGVGQSIKPPRPNSQKKRRIREKSERKIEKVLGVGPLHHRK